MSTRITNSMVQRSVLADLNAVNDRLTRTQEKVASGKQITRPSDDPFNTSRALGIRATLDGTRQYLRNVADAHGWQEATEQALTQITGSIERAKELVVQASSDSLGQAGRDSIQAEIEQLIKGVKQDANTNYRGRFLFSGTATNVQPYPDPAPFPAPDPDTFMGSPEPSAIAREIGPSVSVQMNANIDRILGNGQTAGDDGLLDVLRDISTHLTAADTPSLRTTDLSRLDDRLNDVLAVRATNGALTNRLETADSRLQQMEETLTSQLSQTEDADIAKTLIDFNSQSAAYQAALKAGANIIQPSLMDFLR